MTGDAWKSSIYEDIHLNGLSNEDVLKRKRLAELFDHFNEILRENTMQELLKMDLKSGRLTLEELKGYVKQFGGNTIDDYDYDDCSQMEIDAGSPDDDTVSPDDNNLRPCTTSSDGGSMTRDNLKRAYRYKKFLETTYKGVYKSRKQSQKRDTDYIFKSIGIEHDIEEEHVVQLQYIGIERQAECRQYRLPDDSYFYCFHNGSANASRDRCLSVGSCSFFPFYENNDFKYDAYRRYLDKSLDIFSKKGLMFSPTKLHNFEGERTLEDCYVIEDGWETELDYADTRDNISAVMRSFKDCRKCIHPSIFSTRYEQAQKIQNCKSYSILKFGQFQTIYGFLMRYSVISGKGFKVLGKFDRYVHHCTLICRCAKDEPSCSSTLKLIIDCLHQIVILKFEGTHAESCFIMNRHMCYPAFRNLYLSTTEGVSMDLASKSIKQKYSRCYQCVKQLGFVPTGHDVLNWRAKEMYSDDRIVRDKSTISDYKTCVGLISDLLPTDILTMSQGKCIAIPMDGNCIVHPFSYTDISRSSSRDSAPGLIYTSIDSLKAMVESKTVSIDATFNMIKDDDVKFITVIFKREGRLRAKSNDFLGCIGTLPLSESSVNFQIFFMELVKLIKNVLGQSVEIKWRNIMTNDSKPELTGIGKFFGDTVSVRNCTWHKRLTFEKNLDIKGLSLANGAMYADSELQCVNLLLQLALHYDTIYQKLLNKEVTEVKWTSRKRDRTNKLTSIKTTSKEGHEAIRFMKLKVAYVYKLFKTRYRWSFFAMIKDIASKVVIRRLTSHSLNQSGYVSLKTAQERLEALRDKFMKNAEAGGTIMEFNNEETETEAGASEPHIMNDLMGDLLDDEEGVDEDEVEEAAIEISSFLSTQANESIHSSLKNGHGIEGKANMVEFTDAVLKYFEYQDRRMMKRPRQTRVAHYMKGMIFLKKLSAYKQGHFIAEMSDLFGKKTNIMKGFKLGELCSFNESVSCQFCKKSIALNLPCRHMMAIILAKCMLDFKTDNKYDVTEKFIKRLDKILVQKFFKRTAQKMEENARERANGEDDDDTNQEVLLENHISGEDLDREGLEFAQRNELVSWIQDFVKTSVDGTYPLNETERRLKSLCAWALHVDKSAQLPVDNDFFASCNMHSSLFIQQQEMAEAAEKQKDDEGNGGDNSDDNDDSSCEASS
jgi:hypothetical protein